MKRNLRWYKKGWEIKLAGSLEKMLCDTEKFPEAGDNEFSSDTR